MKYLVLVINLFVYSCMFFVFGLFGNLFCFIGEKMIDLSDYSIEQFELTEKKF